MNQERTSFKPWVPYLVIFLLSTAIGWPLFCDKVIHLGDGQYAFIKAVAMSESWKHGDFVGRWTPDVVHGNGYPMFNFYAPLFFYVYALLMFLPLPAFGAFNLCIYLGLLGSGLTMYLFAREIWGRPGGLLAAVAYLTVPYHLLDLYARGALGEFTAFVFFPLILRAIYRLMRHLDLRDLLIGIASMAGLVLSHNIATLLFGAFSFAYFVFLFLTDTGRSLRKLVSCAGLYIGGIALTTYFWLPALMEKKYVQIERLLTGIYDYRRNFISFWQLIVPSWPHRGHELSFMIGPVHLVLALAVVLLWFPCARASKEKGLQVAFFTAALCVAIMLTLPLSQHVWQHVPLLSFAEFPWRFLMCAAAGISIIIGGLIFLFKESIRENVAWGACAVLIAGSAFSWHTFGYQNIPYNSPREYLHASLPMDNMEYLPKTVTRIFLGASTAKLESLSGPMDISLTQQKYLQDIYRVHGDHAGLLCYHTYNFPGWKVVIDGREAFLQENPWGLIMFAVPPGDSQVRIYFTQTPVRQAAGGITKIVFGVFILCVLFYSPLNRILFRP